MPTLVAEDGQRVKQKGSPGAKARGTQGAQWPSSTVTAPCYRSSRCCGTTQVDTYVTMGARTVPAAPSPNLTDQIPCQPTDVSSAHVF